MPSFFKSRLNLTMLITLAVQCILIGFGKVEVNEASATAIAGNVAGLLFRIQDDGQKQDAKGQTKQEQNS